MEYWQLCISCNAMQSFKSFVLEKELFSSQYRLILFVPVEDTDLCLWSNLSVGRTVLSYIYHYTYIVIFQTNLGKKPNYSGWLSWMMGRKWLKRNLCCYLLPVHWRPSNNIKIPWKARSKIFIFIKLKHPIQVFSGVQNWVTILTNLKPYNWPEANSSRNSSYWKEHVFSELSSKASS